MLVTYAVGNAVGTAVARATLGRAVVALRPGRGALLDRPPRHRVRPCVARRGPGGIRPGRWGLLVPHSVSSCAAGGHMVARPPIFAGWVERATWQGIAELALTPRRLRPGRARGSERRAARGFQPARVPGALPAGAFRAAAIGACAPRWPSGRRERAPCPTFRARVTTVHPVETATPQGSRGCSKARRRQCRSCWSWTAEGRLRGVLRVLPTPALLARIGVPGGRAVRWAGYLRPAGSGRSRAHLLARPGGLASAVPSLGPLAGNRTGGLGVARGRWKQPLGCGRNTP